MAAQNTDKLRKVARKWVGQVGAGGVENGTITTVPLASTANLPTETAIMITIDRVDANGVLTPDKEEGIIGVVSGDNLISCLRGVEGTAQAHSAGAVVEVLWTAKNVNDIVDAILAEHSQSGAHTTDTISEKTEDAGVTVDSLLIKDGRIAGWDGWMPAEETWTYASATTITVPSGAASKYQKGDKIKLTQTTVKYFYIVGVADTVLTITGGTDYTLVNAAISANYYSKAANPQGFPHYFNFSATFTDIDNGSGGQPTVSEAKFFIANKTVNVHVFINSCSKVGNTPYIGLSETNLPVFSMSNNDSLGVPSCRDDGVDITPIRIYHAGAFFYALWLSTIADNSALSFLTWNFSYQI